MTDLIDDMLRRAREARRALAKSSAAQRDDALGKIAAVIDRWDGTILPANAEDMEIAKEQGISSSMLDRLRLNASRLRAISESARAVAALPDPLGEERELGTRPNGLKVSKRRVPLGVIAVVYEARPNVTVECAALCIKSGNAIVLRGGKEAMGSNRVLARAVRQGLADAGLPVDCVQLVHDAGREHVAALLGATGRVDLCIPRGGAKLMEMVDAHAKVPVIRHGQGICHVYVDEGADAKMAAEVAVNAKVSRPGVCNSMETLLVHKSVIDGGLWLEIAKRMRENGVMLRVDERCAKALSDAKIEHLVAKDSDWDTEFLSLELAVRAVDSLDEAMEHIAKHGTEHTASIVSGDRARAERFLREVEASCVLWNASTRFNDGGELGLGAEIGISTSRMHAWGPMGLRELTAEKYVVVGEGQVRG
ncbi:MAG: glutamate-5-semialdehyde dehydrogenase [Myxococcales bacterium]|nr:glutamate-5-semialdehyde dehydrogenase [Myxococcales bacterium]